MKGYRAFEVSTGEGEIFLGASVMHDGDTLEYPLGEAVCPNGEHRAPVADCTCGYYAFSIEGRAREYDRGTTIVAEINGYGRIEQHEEGWRARYVQVLSFYAPFCARCQEPATLAHAEKPIGWRSKVHFYCESHDPGELNPHGLTQPMLASIARESRDDAPALALADAEATPGRTHFTVDDVMQRLAAKYQAFVFDGDSSSRLVALGSEWAHQRESEMQRAVQARADHWRRERDRVANRMQAQKDQQALFIDRTDAVVVDDDEQPERRPSKPMSNSQQALFGA